MFYKHAHQITSVPYSRVYVYIKSRAFYKVLYCHTLVCNTSKASDQIAQRGAMSSVN